jgi:hypothetical protein
MINGKLGFDPISIVMFKIGLKATHTQLTHWKNYQIIFAYENQKNMIFIFLKIKFHHLKGDIASRIVVYYIDGEMSKKTLVRAM